MRPIAFVELVLNKSSFCFGIFWSKVFGVAIHIGFISIEINRHTEIDSKFFGFKIV